MKNERILSYKMSKKISLEEMNAISAAGSTNSWTANGSHQNGQWDGCVDVSVDM